jgi:hypothetical protein
MGESKVVVAVRAQLALPVRQQLRVRPPGEAFRAPLGGLFEPVEDALEQEAGGGPRQALCRVDAEAGQAALFKSLHCLSIQVSWSILSC